MIISGLLFRQRPPAKYEKSLPFTTVVIAARNEEDKLPSLLGDLVNQKIDKNKFEVYSSIQSLYFLMFSIK